MSIAFSSKVSKHRYFSASTQCGYVVLHASTQCGYVVEREALTAPSFVGDATHKRAWYNYKQADEPHSEALPEAICNPERQADNETQRSENLRRKTGCKT